MARPAEGAAVSRAQHTHDDTNRLVVGCPACIERVKRDQEVERWHDAPVRRCTWSFACGQYGELRGTADVRVPAGADAWQVEDWHAGIVGGLLYDALIAAGCPPDDAPMYMGVVARCIIGPVVEDVAAAAPVEHPSLFEVAT